VTSLPAEGAAAFGVVTRATLLPAPLAAVVVGPEPLPDPTVITPSMPWAWCTWQKNGEAPAFGNLTMQASPALVMCGLALGGVEPLVPGRRLAGPDRMGLATGDPERHRPARLDCDLGRLPLVAAVPSISSLRFGLAEGGAAEEREAVVRT
jgi:hypothetical protein